MINRTAVRHALLISKARNLMDKASTCEDLLKCCEDVPTKLTELEIQTLRDMVVVSREEMKIYFDAAEILTKIPEEYYLDSIKDEIKNVCPNRSKGAKRLIERILVDALYLP